MTIKRFIFKNSTSKSYFSSEDIKYQSGDAEYRILVQFKYGHPFILLDWHKQVYVRNKLLLVECANSPKGDNFICTGVYYTVFCYHLSNWGNT